MTRFPSRIACLTEETTETLYLLGQGDRVVGVSGYTVRPPEAREWSDSILSNRALMKADTFGFSRTAWSSCTRF